VADGRDGIATDTDVGLVPGVAGSIHDPGVVNQNVKRLYLEKEA
jgi:hypothetical protein